MTTQYLNLNKPTGSDLVNPLTDTFPNWDIVDNAYHELDSRAIGHATELVSQGVHAITRVDQYAKTFKFIATANYEAGETFTVDGIQVNAYTPSGSTLASGSYVSGAVVMASLNADDSAITIYVGGQQTSDNSLRLGGQLPSYYATQSEVDGLDTDVTNLKNLNGNTSIVGIGDGTTTGAISALNADLTELNSKLDYTTTEKIIGKWIDGATDVYRKTINVGNMSGSFTQNIDSSLTYSNVSKLLKIDISGRANGFLYNNHTNLQAVISSTGVLVSCGNLSYTDGIVIIDYIKA